MNFMIEIRHIESGLAKVFHTVEELAAHLAANVKEEWEGWTHLRLHPALAALDEPVPDTQVPTQGNSEPQDGPQSAPAPSTPAPAEALAASTSEAPSESHVATAGPALTSNFSGVVVTVGAGGQAAADAPAADAPAHDPAQDTTGS